MDWGYYTHLAKPRIVDSLNRMILKTAIVVSALLVGAWYLNHWEVFFNSDFAMIGLLAERILKRGEVFLYVPKVGYQGLLIEGYFSALLFKLFGTSPYVLHLTALIAFWVFLVSFYSAVRVWFTEKIAGLSTVLICFSSPLFFANVLRTQPNYPETYAIGCFLFWSYKKWIDSKNDAFLYGAALAAGFGFYLYGQIIYFVLAVGVSWLLPLIYKQNQLAASSKSVLLGFLALGGLASVIPTVKLAGVAIPGAAVGTLCGVVCVMKVLWPLKKQLLDLLIKKKKVLGVASFCFLVGYSPNLYHRFVLGLFAKSGIKLIKFSEELWLNTSLLLGFFDEFFIGVPNKSVGVGLSLVVIGLLVKAFWSEWRSHKRNQPVNPFFLLGAIVPVAFMASRSVVEPFSLRYLLCLQLVLCIVLAVFLNEGWQKKSRSMFVLGAAWIGLGIWTNLRAPGFYRRTEVYPQLTQIADVTPLMTALEENAVFYAYSDYWPAYLINFVSQGRFTLEPLYSNYLPFYEDELNQQEKVAIIKAKNKKNVEPLLLPQSTACTFKNVDYRVLKYQDLSDWDLWILSR